MNFLQQWQQQHGLLPDGKLGPITTAALMASLKIPSKKGFLMFMAQVEHETVGYAKNRENLNYSPEGILATFNTKSRRFSMDEAQRYGRTKSHLADPVKIANIAYANRGGNGDAGSGDGWKYRGGGALHTTFKDNWLAYFADAGLPDGTDPKIVDDPDHFFATGKFWMDENHAWAYTQDASRAGVKQLSNLINAGNAKREADPNGLDSRLQLTANMLSQHGLA